jgi:transcriptional regulator with XRE-family HTH domain
VRTSVRDQEKEGVRYSGQIAERVVRLRKERDWSQRRLAREVGVSADTISRVENGQALGVSFATMLLIQAVLGLPSIELLVDDPPPTPSAAFGTALRSRAGTTSTDRSSPRGKRAS